MSLHRTFRLFVSVAFDDRHHQPESVRTASQIPDDYLLCLCVLRVPMCAMAACKSGKSKLDYFPDSVWCEAGIVCCRVPVVIIMFKRVEDVIYRKTFGENGEFYVA